jgi:hypothetical protein
MLVQRVILSGEPPSSLKQDIKGITDSLAVLVWLITACGAFISG